MTTSPEIPFRVAELLCSRLCHDLISPVAAVSNGLELIGDENGGIDAEVEGLLRFSIGQAAGWLTFFRVAYGLGGDNADAMTLSDTGRLIGGIVEQEKIAFASPRGEHCPGRGPVKLLLNMGLLGLEALPNRGNLAVALDPDARRITVLAEAEGAALRPETIEAIDPGYDPELLTPRSVQGYFTSWLARKLGGRLSVDSARRNSISITTAITG